MLYMIARFTLLLSLSMGALFTFGCSEKPQHIKIDLENRQPITKNAATESSKAVLRIAIAGVVSPTETLASYSKLASYFSRELHQEVEIVQRSMYAEINDLVRSRYVDLAFV